MLPLEVLCGGVSGQADSLELKIGPQPDNITLQIDRLSRKLADDIPEMLVDLLELAAYVYAADQFVSRGSTKMAAMGAAWRRRFHFRIPVRRPEIWSRSDIRTELENTLGFLTEDEFSFTFEGMKVAVPFRSYLPFNSSIDDQTAPDEVILFSGGLDSLAGAINALSLDGRQIVLVSHQSANMIASRQRHLSEALGNLTSLGRLLHVSVIVNRGGDEASEFTQRSRSFLFATLGCVVARLLGRSDLSFYENGIVSINLPISEHVIGARASRTTHPQVLKAFSRLFSLILDRPFEVRNPFIWWTKADVVRAIVDQGCGNLIAESFSCARVREATRTGQHCGRCSQCIDRRFGILAAKASRHDPSQNYAFDLFRGSHAPGTDLTMSESYVLRAQKMASMSMQGFAATYGQIFRVISSLPEKADASARMIWELHRRHATDVVSVVDAEIRNVDVYDVPERSLLGLLRSPLAGFPLYLDPAEAEPAASAQAPDIARLQWRPVILAFDERRRKVIFEDGFEIGGATYNLLQALGNQHKLDRGAGLHPELFNFIASQRLADSLHLEPQSLRQVIFRARRAIDASFRKHSMFARERDDVIQTQGWRGYRLNPHVLIVGLSALRQASPSRFAMGDVTNPSTAH